MIAKVTLPLLVAVALSACSGESQISLAFAPVGNVTAVPGADRVLLDVVSEDKRPQFADPEGVGRSSRLRLVADKDVAELVRTSVEQALQAEGFVVAAGGLVVAIQLQDFFCRFSLTASASVGYTLRVRDPAGRTVYSRFYEGKATAGPTLIEPQESCKAALERAFLSSIKQLAGDKALQTALLSMPGSATQKGP
jgi:uncharacterized lipoprotein YajG